MPGSGSPQHEQKKKEIAPSSREQLRWLNEVAADVSFHDYLSADADTIEVLGDQEIVHLVSGAQKVSQDADNLEIAEAAMPAPRQATDAVDLLRRFCSGSRKNRGCVECARVLQKVCLPTASETQAGENHRLFQ